MVLLPNLEPFEVGSMNQWVVKNQQGVMEGPYTTQEVLGRIKSGLLNGEELISPYPNISWHPIGQEPEFYDSLLEVLAGEAKGPSGKSRSIDFDKTRNMSFTDENTAPPPEDEFPPRTSRTRTGGAKTSETRAKVERQAPRAKAKSAEEPEVERFEAKVSDADDTIELSDLKTAEKKAYVSQLKKPLIVGLGLLIVLLLLLPKPEEQKGGRIHYLMPRSDRPAISDEEATKKMQGAVANFIQDGFESYRRAESLLVQVIEGQPRKADALALLCLTQLELWPFVFQDAQDLATLAELNRLSSASGDQGPNGLTCKAVQALLKGQVSLSASITNTALEAAGNSETPPVAMYYLRARQLMVESELRTALGYIRSAKEIWPQWARVYQVEGEIYERLQDFNSAVQVYLSIQKSRPKHLASKLSLALIRWERFNQIDDAFQEIVQVLNQEPVLENKLLARGYLAAAQISVRYERPDEALRYAQKAYQLNPASTTAKDLVVRLGGRESIVTEDLDVRQLLAEGDQMARQNAYTEALAFYKSAYELDPDNPVAAYKAATSYWELSFSYEALAWLDKAIVADPKYIQAYVRLADYHSQRFEFLKAAQVLQRANQVAPRNYEVMRGFALAEYRRNNPDGAIGYAEKALSFYEEDLESVLLLAKSYLMKQNYTEAFKSATKAVELDSNHREAQVVYAKALGGVQGVDSGVSYLTRLIETFPLALEYRTGLAEYLVSDERYIDAIDVLKQIIDIDSKNKPARLLIGDCYRALDRNQMALDQYLQSSVIDPADAEPLFRAGTLYIKTKQFREARRQFERVLNINPKYPLVHYQLGRAALLGNDPKKAVEQAKLEARLNPSLAEPYLLAAEAYSEMKEYSLCAREYQKAIQLGRLGSDGYVKVARCYRLASNLDAAVSMLNIASEMESGNPQVYKEQGAVYEIRGDIELALKAYKLYVELNPGAPDRAQIERRIQKLGGS